MWVSVFGPFVFPKLHRDCFLVLDGSVTVNNGAGKSIGEVGKWFSRCRKLCGGHVRLNTFYFGSANKTKNVFIINNRNFVRIQTPATPQSTGSRKQRKWRMPCTPQTPARACNHGKNRLIIFRAVTLRIMIVLSIALWSNASLAYCSGVVTYTLLMLYNHRCRHAGIWTFCTLNTSKRTVPSAARTQSRATLIYKQQTSRGIDYRRSYANLVRLVTNHIGPYKRFTWSGVENGLHALEWRTLVWKISTVSWPPESVVNRFLLHLVTFTGTA